MTLSEFIKALQSVEKEHGKKEVVLSADAEGNCFHKVSNPLAISPVDNALILYPNHEPFDL